jgi:FMN phosphatase YigB (HAD superfamily)
LNVVFDLGGVVFSWRPDDIINRIFDGPETQSLVKARIFEHNDGVELDRGTLGIEEAVFIDDMSENLDAASLLGIQTIQFINAAQCRQDLMSLGCI